MDLDVLTNDERLILWAALSSMLTDAHWVKDELTGTQRDIAESLLQDMGQAINEDRQSTEIAGKRVVLPEGVQPVVED